MEQRQQLQQVCHRVGGATFDLEYDTQALKSIGLITEFDHILEGLRHAVELKCKLDERQYWRSQRLGAVNKDSGPQSVREAPGSGYAIKGASSDSEDEGSTCEEDEQQEVISPKSFD